MKKLLSVLLAIAMVLTMAVVPAVAETAEQATGTTALGNYYKFTFGKDGDQYDYNAVLQQKISFKGNEFMPFWKTTEAGWDTALSSITYKTMTKSDGSNPIDVMSWTGLRTSSITLLTKDGVPFEVEPGKTYAISMDYYIVTESKWTNAYTGFGGWNEATWNGGRTEKTPYGAEGAMNGTNSTTFNASTGVQIPVYTRGWAINNGNGGEYQYDEYTDKASHKVLTKYITMPTNEQNTGNENVAQYAVYDVENDSWSFNYPGNGTNVYTTNNYFYLFLGGGSVVKNEVTYYNTYNFKSIEIYEVTDPVVEYVENGEVTGTVTEGLTVGGTYAPDRMPVNAAPEGKYFAGWADANGNMVVDAINVLGTTNKLVAVYKDYVSGTVSADLLSANLPTTTTGVKKVLMPSVVDGVYQGHIAYKGWAAATDGSDATGTYVRHHANNTWSENTRQILHNSNGEALMAKPETTYKIELTYRLAAYPETFTATWEDYNNGGSRTGWSLYMMVGTLPAKRNDLQSDNGQSGNYGKATPQEHYTWFDHGPGLGFWKDVAGDGEWHTETFRITTKSAEQYAADGYIPVFAYATGSGSNTYKVDIKSVVITEVAGTVNYYVGEEIVKSVDGLKIGSAYAPDYIPATAPEGTTFAGWKNAEGEIVNSLTVAEGDNNLYAYFKEATTVAYYVNGVQEGETITGLNEGDTYAPDRMPTAAAPEGKYFAGWKYNGEYVVDSITIADGKNRLEAAYKDYVTGTVEADIFKSTAPTTTAGGASVLLPSVVSDVYQGYTAFSGYGHVTDTTESGESFVRYTSYADWSNPTLQIMRDADGVALQAKPETTYKIEFTYRNPSYSDSAAAYSYETWKASQSSSDRTGFMMYMNVGFDPSVRNSFTNSIGCSGSTWKATAQEHHTWYDHGPGMGFWSDVAGDGWVTETFMITTRDTAAYEAAGYLPVFTYYIGTNHTKNKVDVKSVVITELSIHDDLQDATIAEQEVGYVKILDEVEDNATYKVTFNGNLTANDIGWSSVYALTANADNVNLNQSLIYGYNADHGVKGTMGSFGYNWTQTYTSFITTDLAAEEGNALYLYVTNTALLAQLNLISIEKVEGVKNGGVSMLAGAKETDKQALRYYFNYTTVNGNDIVIDGETYTIASRGFLLADADKVGDKTVTRTTAAEKDSGIIDANTTELTKCWGYTDNGDGTAKLEFSTYITGFKPDEGTYNNTNKLYVKGYVVLTNGSVIYSEESKMTVADVANLINAGGGRVH